MKSTDILLKDLFDYKGLKISHQNFQSFLKFLSFEETRVMFVQDGILFVDDVVRLIHKEQNYLKIENHLSSDYYSENVKLPEYMKTEYHGDTLVFLSKSKLPMSRVSNEYDTIFDAPASYLNLFEETYAILLSSIVYLMTSGIIELTFTEEKQTNKIREFLKNEFNKN
jgi:hypothetical protein